MTAPQFTPGPLHAVGREVWVIRNGFEAGMLCRSVPETLSGSTYEQSLDETIANARLIAAAPDGFEAGEQAIEALNAMMDAWFDYHDRHSLTQPVTGAAGNAFDLALAAREKLEAFVAKARGDL